MVCKVYLNKAVNKYIHGDIPTYPSTLNCSTRAPKKQIAITKTTRITLYHFKFSFPGQ